LGDLFVAHAFGGLQGGPKAARPEVEVGAGCYQQSHSIRTVVRSGFNEGSLSVRGGGVHMSTSVEKRAHRLELACRGSVEKRGAARRAEGIWLHALLQARSEQLEIAGSRGFVKLGLGAGSRFRRGT